MFPYPISTSSIALPRGRSWLRCVLLLLALLASTAQANDQIPGSLENVALVGGTVHTANGPVENAVVVTQDGKIVGVIEDAAAYKPAADVTVIDVAGRHVYPGMIDAATTVGLTEIGAVRATRDLQEAGGGDAINPNAAAQLAYNPDSELIPTVRANGVLVAHVHPTGGLVAGQSALMRLDGYTYEEATIVPRVGLIVNWPEMLPNTSWWEESSPEEQAEQRDKQIATLETAFDEAQRYRQTRQAETEASADTFDIRLEAMLPVLDGELPVLISAEEQSQIEAAVAFGKRRGLRMILLGGAEADRCVETLRAANVPVILTGVHRLPRGRDADVDQPGKLPAALRDAGIEFAIASAGGPPVSGGARWPMLARNLPYHAAEAVAHGLTRDEAVAAITFTPAKLLGVDDQLGSLEEGKAATLFVSDGDILDVRSNVTHAWIDGRRVDLSSRHTQLRDKYRRRLETD